MNSATRNPKGVNALYLNSEVMEETFSKIFALSFPDGKNGFDMAVELGLTPKLAKLLLDSSIEETARERERLFGSKSIRENFVDEATAFYFVLETFSSHWLTCDGDLEKALILTSERILSFQEG